MTPHKGFRSERQKQPIYWTKSAPSGRYWLHMPAEYCFSYLNSGAQNIFMGTKSCLRRFVLHVGVQIMFSSAASPICRRSQLGSGHSTLQSILQSDLLSIMHRQDVEAVEVRARKRGNGGNALEKEAMAISYNKRVPNIPHEPQAFPILCGIL